MANVVNVTNPGATALVDIERSLRSMMRWTTVEVCVLVPMAYPLPIPYSKTNAVDTGGGDRDGTDLVTLEGNQFFSNIAYEGGALRLTTLTRIRLRDHFCDNSTDGGIGGAVYLDGGAGDASVWTNTVFNENLANTSGGALYIENHDIELRNNLFLTNDASDGGALYFDNSDFELINSVMAWTVGGDGVDANWATSGTYTMDYNNWYSNTSANYAGSLTASSLGSTVSS